PGDRQLIVETLGQGDLLGLPSLVPPYQSQFSATAVADTMAVEFNAASARAACESGAGLRYQLLQRGMSAAASPLPATRIGMLAGDAAATRVGGLRGARWRPWSWQPPTR